MSWRSSQTALRKLRSFGFFNQTIDGLVWLKAYAWCLLITAIFSRDQRHMPYVRWLHHITISLWKGRFCDHPFYMPSTHTQGPCNETLLRNVGYPFLGCVIPLTVQTLDSRLPCSLITELHTFTTKQNVVAAYTGGSFPEGLSFKASQHHWDSALKRRTDTAFAYRLTSERVQQHD
jgi:hypothetical protein